MNRPRVVVLLSSYNGERYIEEQINSIINQQGEFELHLIVRDDGSKDSTCEILARYKLAGKLDYYQGVNIGAAHSFIDLLFNCDNYDFYAFADQDDIWCRDKIHKAIKNIGNCELPILYFSNAKIVNDKLETIRELVYQSTPRTDFSTLSIAGSVLGCTMVFNDALVKIIRSYPKPTRIVMHDFYLSVLASALNSGIIYDCTPSVLYRQHSDNVVGVAHGKKSEIIKSRIKDITNPPRVSVADQALEIIKVYGDIIDSDKLKWLNEVAKYRESFIRKLAIIFSRQTRYINFNMGLKIRLSLLLGNR